MASMQNGRRRAEEEEGKPALVLMFHVSSQPSSKILQPGIGRRKRAGPKQPPNACES
jgi:hypothetical protein